MSWMKTSTVLLVLVLAVIMITAGCTQTPTTTPTTTAATAAPTPLPTTKIVTIAPTSNASGIANPASEYCVQVGGNVSIKKDAQGNEYGVCNFPNGTSYDEWALFRGEVNTTATNATPTKSVVNKTVDAVKNATSNATANLTAAKTAANATNSTAK